MNTPHPIAKFVHLRLHSEFSVVDGIVRIDDAVEAALNDNMPALALTDLSNLFGMVKFYKAARKQGLKAIIGADIWVSNLGDREKPFRLLLLCKDRQGYGRLCEILSRSFRENQFRGRGEVLPDWLLHRPDAGQDNAGLIALAGFQYGEVGVHLTNGNQAAAVAAAEWLSAQFADSTYLEIQRVGDKQQETLVHAIAALSVQLQLPLVATHPVQFMAQDDFKAHEARVGISEGFTLSDSRRVKRFTPQQYFTTQAEMHTLFSDYPEALENTVHIAERCNLLITLGKNYLPDFPTPPGMTLDEFMVEKVREGLENRLLLLYPDPERRDAERPRYLVRLKYETDTIIQMGFPGYFMIVADFINWAKHNGCPVGPGRGSGAGSLVAYALGITDLDPTQYALLFERFLNPERVSMPDFDIDFCQDNRGRVIEYVRATYGTDAVSQIATFGTLAAKAVIRDVGRVMDLPYLFCDGLSKLIPAAPGKQYSLDDALEMEPLLKERVENEEEVAELWVLAKKLEGLTRNIGTHAGGVLIAPGRLTDFCPLYAQPGSDSVVSQFDKDDVEAVGLVKFDFLGLRNLTIIELAVKYIAALSGEQIDISKLPLTDAAAYKVFAKANTTAVFQFESTGMKKMLLDAKPSKFEEIIAFVALYRPGPMDLIPDFTKRMHGERFEYLHPLLEPVLAPTYGIMVYQEQVMQAAQVIGGYSLGGADLLRRAMGKKKLEEMIEQRANFVKGAAAQGIEAAKANEIFDYMEKFAGYGFNKSHAAAYALVAYHTAWLKAHHCAAFMAATMSTELDNTDQLRVFVEDALDNKLVFLPPDVNLGFYRFVPVDRTHVRYALGAIKGTGEQAVEHLIAEREANGPYTSLFDFCRRTDKRMVNRRTIEALIRAGAFDSIETHRAALLASVSLALDDADQAAANAKQISLFDAFDEPEHELQLLEAAAWSEREQLQEEKLALGFYLSGHPYHSYKAELAPFLRTRLSSLSPDRSVQRMAGVLTSFRSKITQRGKMGFLTLDDATSTLDVMLYSEHYDLFSSKLREDALLIVEGKVSKDDFNGGIKVVAENILTLEEARTRFASAISITYPAGLDPAVFLDAIHPYCADEGCLVEIKLRTDLGQGIFQLGEAWRVLAKDTLLSRLIELCGAKQVEMRY